MQVAFYVYRHIHLVSFVNAIALSWLSFKALHHPSLEGDKAFGWHESIGKLDAVAVGYALVLIAVSMLY